MLASMFVVGGMDAVRNSESKVKAADAVVRPLARVAPWLPSDPEVFVRFNGAVQVGAGALLATGKFKRLASLALIGSIIPTTYAGHRFWEETEEREPRPAAHTVPQEPRPPRRIDPPGKRALEHAHHEEA